MPGIRESRTVPYSAEQMFDLVADVARYKEFLPWVIATRVRSDSEDEMIADMVVGFKSFRESFTSRVTKRRPEMIDVVYVDGPLRDLDNEWHFTDLPEGGSRIDFSVQFTFKNRVFEALAGQYFDRAFRKMVAAFEDRARDLYGSSSSSAHSVA
ncbi:type II toxin-antitoxin system RatA family toxin [Pelagerythrobacter marinus]|uniref:Type II toxin-antitoxin system RatA family toxin n=1 Tax=Pelagerythrobacter marinus TaxID=538382 RepID=A0ABW9UTK8_9SPHN|nr:type II toxin-antitoxin system RatA family toxin [Pelagerythrobacter marinus]MEC9066324.1 type II toxin-antitoxin system RatA family toxin [Pseudomonadota bacterium]MXO68184.1 type II toxin-antitoxin system RatA family toxin [Pelagerythrobacter marinus]USA40655.1 type II toxin-antitoxin system RatA family toxin [Pelagerythrobacter marinus]WPZ08173.1 type II toxin-antitoxin system RatA family toxin [Pelagerythrobacter marinus]